MPSLSISDMQQSFVIAIQSLRERGSKFFVAGALIALASGALRIALTIQSWSTQRISSSRLGIPANWKYRAEGALNLVVAYCGTDPRLVSSVLRLRKRKIGAVSASSSCEESYEFTKALLPLMRSGSDFLPQGELVCLDRSFLKAIHWQCQSQRPQNRLVAEIDDVATYGLLLPDLSALPGALVQDASRVLSCEIKPKSCILPKAACVSPEHKIKSQVARFTMMQHSKLKSGKVNSISSYDPTDLFSNNQGRMRSAIWHLLQTPQNNFVLRSLDAEGLSVNLTQDASRESVVARCLAVEQSEAIAVLADLLATVLAECGVLDEVRHLQALDRFDIENVYWMHRHLCNPRQFSEEEARVQAPGTLPEAGAWERAVRDFLVAQSAKDCSVILTLAFTSNDSQGGAALPGHEGSRWSRGCRRTTAWSDKELIYRCGLVDLDAKQASKIEGYWEQDRSIVQEYLTATRSAHAIPQEAKAL